MCAYELMQLILGWKLLHFTRQLFMQTPNCNCNQNQAIWIFNFIFSTKSGKCFEVFIFIVCARCTIKCIHAVSNKQRRKYIENESLWRFVLAVALITSFMMALAFLRVKQAKQQKHSMGKLKAKKFIVAWDFFLLREWKTRLDQSEW